MTKIKFYQNSYFWILVLVSLFFWSTPNYTQAQGLYSAKAKVSWTDNGAKTNEKRAYIFTGETKHYLKYLNDVGPTLYPLEDRQFGYPELNLGLNESACKKRLGGEFVIDNGIGKPLPKGWYMMIPKPQPGQPDNSNIISPATDLESKLSPGYNWGAATVTWGGHKKYERNCDYEYMYLPISSQKPSSALIEGDIYASGTINEATVDPNKNYLAIAGRSTVESLSDISGFNDDDITKVGLYQISSQSTSSKENINKFRAKLDEFINEYANVRYGKDIPSGANQFLKSNIGTELQTPTDSAKNPDGDVYVVDGDLTIDTAINITEQSRKLVYVKGGNLNIKADIKSPDSSAVAFVVDSKMVNGAKVGGNINVDGIIGVVKNVDVENINAGLISLNGTVELKHIDDSCKTNPCRRLDINGLIIGNYINFKRKPEIITFLNPKDSPAGVFLKYNPKISKLPAFDQLLADPSASEVSP